MRKNIFILILAVALPLNLSAQKAYIGSIEGGIGPSAAFYTVHGEAGSALGTASGDNRFIRYTHYLKRGFGLYGELRSIESSATEHNYFGALNKADGEKYRYRFKSGEYDISYQPMLTLGGAFRKEYDAINLVFRAGAGYGERSNDFSYERQSRDNSKGPEYFTIAVTGESDTDEYLLDAASSTVYYAPAFILSTSAQLVWKLIDRLYIFGEAGFDWSPCSYDVEISCTGSKIDYNPINWAEAVAYHNKKDAWVTDNSSKSVTSDNFNMGSHLNFSFGIGINLWKEFK